MLHLKNFEVETDFVLLKELLVLIIFVESWSTELKTPPRSIVFLGCAPDVPRVRVKDHVLVVVCFSEGPWGILV